MVTQAHITGHIVIWARERLQLSQATVAKRLNVKESTLDMWERGRATPTFKQAMNIAAKLKVPFGYLYLSEPPDLLLPLPDLRTTTGQPPGIPSPEFLDVLHDVQRKQAWYREYLEAEHADQIPFVGRFQMPANANDVATDIQATLGLDNEMRSGATGWEDFLVQFVRRAEDAGILVLRVGIVGSDTRRKLDVEEFRGFAIADRVAPLVCINSRDAKAAQNFTLAHELAHIWIAKSGVSNPDYRRRAVDQANDIEKLCNRIAANTLVPEVDFLAHWEAEKDIEEQLRFLTRRYKVSTLVILRQALDLGQLDDEHYWSLFEDYRNGKAQQSKGVEFYYPFFARNSRTFTAAVIEAVGTGRLSRIDAGKLLNVKAQTVKKIASQLLAGPPISA